ncbi:hypothetical protein GCM10025868_06650 [Angustibacter aerolatus]|uniref:Mur ligase central domain-containing protein n=1 Tax=Angustibacter aerolatus TaxID=1162965 RepID=A0ABQ6JDY8_9ACTN|nr:Mur ligase family protein [Angustibacter aerolatus]GMA85415.1 hypothetical protein GCM10025868_06650 [Angustibacter aerolatus]
MQPDHLDHYGDAAGVERGFDAFAATVRPGGSLVACADDEGSARLAARAVRDDLRVVTYGTVAEAHVRAVDVRLDRGGASFDVVVLGRRVGGARIDVPGRHNVLNALAATAAAIEARRAGRGGAGRGRALHRHPPAVRVARRRGRGAGL